MTWNLNYMRDNTGLHINKPKILDTCQMLDSKKCNLSVPKSLTTHLLVALETNKTIIFRKCTNVLSLKCVFFQFLSVLVFCAMLLSPSGSTCQPRIIIQTKPNSPKSIINGHNYRIYNIDYILHTVLPRL